MDRPRQCHDGRPFIPGITSALTDQRLKRRLGCQLGPLSANGLWSETEKQLHINLLELKAVLLSLEHFRDQCFHQEVMVATDNTSMVAYINNRVAPDRAKCTLSGSS